MSDDIKKLVDRLRATFFEVRDFSLHDVRDAANALEAMIGELEAYEIARVTWMTMMREWINRALAAEAERDRLKAALETIAEGRDSGRHDGLPEEHPAHSAVLMHYIACEALEAKE